MKRQVFFTMIITSLLGLQSNGYTTESKPLNEGDDHKWGTRSNNVKTDNGMSDQKIQSPCRSTYIPTEEEFVGYDRKRDVALFREKNNETFMQRFWNVVASYKPKK